MNFPPSRSVRICSNLCVLEFLMQFKNRKGIMPIDNEVAKERIWKEHCQKLTNLSIHSNQQSEFTLNPFRLQHNKPVADPVNPRAARFLDRSRVALESLATILEKSGSDVSPAAAMSQLGAAQANKDRAVAGNNIFNSEHSLPRGARTTAAEDWNLLNQELGGGKNFSTVNMSVLPSIAKQPSQTTVSASSADQKGTRDETIQQLLLRASKVPTDKYPQPVLESHTIGWDAKTSRRPLPHFSFGLRKCEITKFQELSGASPKRSTKKE